MKIKINSQKGDNIEVTYHLEDGTKQNHLIAIGENYDVETPEKTINGISSSFRIMGFLYNFGKSLEKESKLAKKAKLDLTKLNKDLDEFVKTIERSNKKKLNK